jgi:protein-disulfide isomerase
MDQGMTVHERFGRSSMFGGAMLFALGLAAASVGASALAETSIAPMSRDQLVKMVLDDPESPVGGNPKGDVTIVAFLDYNCPYCRRSTPELARYIESDPNVRVVFKDWPILSPSSITEAKIALAAKYQGKYLSVHAALMAITLRPAMPEAIKSALLGSGVDIDRLNKDLDAHNDAISDLIRRDVSEADALGFHGTPVFIIGPFVMAHALDETGFRQAVSDARSRLSGSR